MDTMKESQESLPMDSFAEDDLSELLSSLQQILEDIKANDTIYTILELLREDYGDLQEFPLSCKIYRVDKSKERIIQEIQRYIQENRQEKEIDNSIKETNSLDTVYLISTELQGIVGKSECTGREVVLFILFYYRFFQVFGNILQIITYMILRIQHLLFLMKLLLK